MGRMERAEWQMTRAKLWAKIASSLDKASSKQPRLGFHSCLVFTSNTLVRQGHLILTLCCCDAPNEHTKDSLGDNIGNGVTNLLSACRKCAAQPDHLDDVHAWVGEPRDGSQIASLHNESFGRLGLPLSRLRQTNQESVHDIEERHHGHGPPDPTLRIVILDLT